MALDVTADDVAMLEGRTEGWIAAIQLAGISMQGRADVAGFIARFAGDDRYIVDYLVEEVLQRQSEQVRTFLLETSILSRLNGALSDAVTGQVGGRAMLEALERQNLFLIPLDDRRAWYRYHHLFADVLQARLRDERPERVPELHGRAAEWHEHDGERADAIRHAMAGRDFERAADLVELAIPATSRGRQEATLRRWLEALPDEVIRVRPVLSDGYAGTLLVRGETAGVEARLEDAERWLEATDVVPSADGSGPKMVVADQEAFRTLPARIAMHRAGLARLRGDVPGTIEHAHRTLELVDEDDDLGQGAASTLLGLAHWANGDLEAATDLYAGAMTRFERADYLSDAIGLAIAMADMRLAQGRLAEAMSTYERGLALATRGRSVTLRGAADMHVGIGEIMRQRGDIAGAAQQLRQAGDLGEENGLPQNPYRSRVAGALLLASQGDLANAVGLLDEAERVFFSDFSPNVRPIPALRARLWLRQGRLPEALGWARARNLSATDLTYEHEFEHATLARVLLAQGVQERADDHIRAAIDLTERLLVAAEAGGRHGSAIDILIAQALARQADHDEAGATAALGRALAIAEPEGYVRAFLDEGPPMSMLLKLAAKDRRAPSYVRRLLATASVADRIEAAVPQPLIEPLSERELGVLRFLATDLDGPDIARALSISVATVRTHTRTIYSKLGVNNRRAAVRRADELGLLSRTQERRPSE